MASVLFIWNHFTLEKLMIYMNSVGIKGNSWSLHEQQVCHVVKWAKVFYRDNVWGCSIGGLSWMNQNMWVTLHFRTTHTSIFEVTTNFHFQLPVYFSSLTFGLNNKSFWGLNTRISCYFWVIIINERNESWKQAVKVRFWDSSDGCGTRKPRAGERMVRAWTRLPIRGGRSSDADVHVIGLLNPDLLWPTVGPWTEVKRIIRGTSVSALKLVGLYITPWFSRPLPLLHHTRIFYVFTCFHLNVNVKSMKEKKNSVCNTRPWHWRELSNIWWVGGFHRKQGGC